MRGGLSRRRFIAVAGATLAAPRVLLADHEVPRMVDHILLGTKDLDAGIAYVQQRTGLRAAIGGVHPGRGTRNALLSLGERRYLEIIARDPAQAGTADSYGLESLAEPRLVTWAAHPGNIEKFARKLQAEGIAFDGPNPGWRQRPDGRVLEWKTLVLKDNRGGLLPFFIEWSQGTTHPSVDAPQGCRLARFQIVWPGREELAGTIDKLRLDVSVVRGDRPELRATIAGPAGEFEASSIQRQASAAAGQTPSGSATDGRHYQPGQDGIKSPECVYCPVPDFTEKARKEKYQGAVLLVISILPDGSVGDARVTRGLGMGLDENAVATVRRWRFKPILGPGGEPVTVDVPIEVNFRLQ